MFVLRLLWRVVVITLALIASLLVAAGFIGFALVNGFLPETTLATLTDERALDWTILTIAAVAFSIPVAVNLSTIAILPVFIAVITAEFFAWRSVTVYFVIGGLIALFVVLLMFDPDPGQGIDTAFSTGTLLVTLATGFIAALAYWFLAGRKAGKWLDDERSTKGKDGSSGP